MTSPRSTPFIASWDSEDSLDATAPLDESGYRFEIPPARARTAPPEAAPSRLAWIIVSVAGMLAAGALLWAAENNQSRATPTVRPVRTPPSLRADLQVIPARIEVTPPDIVVADDVEPKLPAKSAPRLPRTVRTVIEPRDELAAALLERRRQMSQSGSAGTAVDTVAMISFDPNRSSARVIYHVEDSDREIVEYWALRDGRWQPLDD